MKILGRVLMLAAAAWLLVLSADDGAAQEAAGPAVALLGIGFGLLTVHAVTIGSVRGHSRRIQRSEQPGSFWGVVMIRFSLAATLLAAALWV